MQKGHVDIVKLLLEAGADINAGASGTYSPLKIAEKNGHTEVVKLLEKYQKKEKKK